MRGRYSTKYIKRGGTCQSTHSYPQEHRQATRLPAQICNQTKKKPQHPRDERKGYKSDELGIAHRINGVAAIVYLAAYKRRPEKPPHRARYAVDCERTRE